MLYRKRLERLERVLATRNPNQQCPKCRDRHWIQSEFMTLADLVSGTGQRTEVIPCEFCGWTPRKIVEVVVDTQEDVATFARYQQKRGCTDPNYANARGGNP